MAKKGTFPANAMRRGEIYWVDIPNAIGHELMKDRPAIIVSCDALNDNSPVVQVVYCSASPKKELPEHITIRSTEQISTALCENVYTVDKSRVGRYVGRCTKREMEQVDLGLLSGLGLGVCLAIMARAELLLMDDDTLLVNEELLKGLDEELDSFLKELLEK